MNQERLSPKPFSFVHSGKEYFLCIRMSGEKNIYFFTTTVTNLRNGVSQSELPNAYEVAIKGGMPILVKKA